MALSQPIVYGGPMSRLLCLAIAVVLPLLSVVATAAPIHKKPVQRWHGYGFLPGYEQPVNNSQPLYAQKEGHGGWRTVNGVLGILIPLVAILGMMANGTISASPAFTAATTMAAASDRAGPGHRSGRSGTAAD